MGHTVSRRRHTYANHPNAGQAERASVAWHRQHHMKTKEKGDSNMLRCWNAVPLNLNSNLSTKGSEKGKHQDTTRCASEKDKDPTYLSPFCRERMGKEYKKHTLLFFLKLLSTKEPLILPYCAPCFENKKKSVTR